MNTKLFVVLLLSSFSSLFFCQTVLAHHSTSNYDHSTKVLVEGTVTKFKWTNPHSWVYLNVPTEDGGVEEWAIECGSPVQLLQNNWTREDVEAGDHVRIIAWIARDGTRRGEMHSLVTDEDRTLFNSSNYKTKAAGE